MAIHSFSHTNQDEAPPPRRILSIALRSLGRSKKRLLGVLCVLFGITTSCTAQSWIDFEFINDTGQDIRVRFELKYYAGSPCGDNTGSSGTWYECIPPSDSFVVGSWDTRYIAWVEVECDCDGSVDAVINCGDDPVIFSCDLVSQLVMGLSQSGWRIEPY